MTDGEMGIETSEPYFPQGPRVCLPYNCAWAEVFPPACWLIYGRRWWLASRTECDAKMDAKDSHSPWLRLWKSVQSIRKKHVYSYVLFLIDGCGQPDQAREQSPNGQRFQMQATRALRWHDFIGLLGSRKTSISEQPFFEIGISADDPCDLICVRPLLSLKYCWVVNMTRSKGPVLSSHALILHMSLLSHVHNRLSIWQWDTEIYWDMCCSRWPQLSPWCFLKASPRNTIEAKL